MELRQLNTLIRVAQLRKLLHGRRRAWATPSPP